MSYPLENSLDYIGDLVDLWNACSSPPFLIDHRLMRQYLEAPGAMVVVHDRPRQGALWARRGYLGTTLDAIMVLPKLRRRGIGLSLIQTFESLLPSAERWRFGGGSHHLVPGLPEAAFPAGGFFQALGMAPDWLAHDLLWQAPDQGAAAWDESSYRLIVASETVALEALLEAFGERWQRDTAGRCRWLEEGRPEEIMGAFQENKLVGFCHIWSARSSLLGPSTFWLPRQDDLWGGIGPLGVHPDQRGLGLGAGVVIASMAYLRQMGALRIGVDWTALSDFYQRCGFKPWLSYRGYSRPAACFSLDQGAGD